MGQRSCGLWLQGETYYQVGFLGAWISSHLSKDWNRERIGNLQILGGFHANMSNGKGMYYERMNKRKGPVWTDASPGTETIQVGSLLT